MRRVWIVAVWEFAGTVMRPGFIATVVGLPLFHLGIGFLLVHSLGAVSRETKVPKPVVIVDAARVLGSARHSNAIVTDEAEALERLRARQADFVFVLADDYVRSGRARAYSRAASGLFHFADAMAQRERARAIIREALLASSPPDPLVARALDPLPAWLADMNNDATINIGDAIQVLKLAVGL